MILWLLAYLISVHLCFAAFFSQMGGFCLFEDPVRAKEILNEILNREDLQNPSAFVMKAFPATCRIVCEWRKIGCYFVNDGARFLMAWLWCHYRAMHVSCDIFWLGHRRSESFFVSSLASHPLAVFGLFSNTTWRWGYDIDNAGTAVFALYYAMVEAHSVLIE